MSIEEGRSVLFKANKNVTIIVHCVAIMTLQRAIKAYRRIDRIHVTWDARRDGSMNRWPNVKRHASKCSCPQSKNFRNEWFNFMKCDIFCGWKIAMGNDGEIRLAVGSAVWRKRAHVCNVHNGLACWMEVTAHQVLCPRKRDTWHNPQFFPPFVYIIFNLYQYQRTFMPTNWMAKVCSKLLSSIHVCVACIDDEASWNCCHGHGWFWQKTSHWKYTSVSDAFEEKLSEIIQCDRFPHINNKSINELGRHI